MEVKVKKSLVKKLIEVGRNCSEEVIYALLGSSPSTITKDKQLKNIDKDKKHRFTPHPQEFFDMLTNTKYVDPSKELYLVAIYHTHPFSDSTPSLRDIGYGLNYNLLYLIYGKKDDKLKAYKYSNNDNNNKIIKQVQIHEIN